MLERGERTATIETLESVCEALEVSPAILFESGRGKGVTREEKLGHLIASLAKGASEADAGRFERVARAFFARK
jgi:transcriptional regulator with XRE-family HTH domain